MVTSIHMTFRPATVWEASIAANVTFGTGAVRELEAIATEFGADRPLVLTDRGVREAGIIDAVEDGLGSIDAEVFDAVDPDPTLTTFEAAIERAAAVDPDLVIGVGGGSAMDVAKTTGIVAAHGGDVLDYVAPPTGEGVPVPGRGIPTVAVATTAGTGSETSPVSVISLPDEDLKVGISSRYQRPDVALVDPALTVTLPPGPTAASGMDALSHAIEAYVTRPSHARERPAHRGDRPVYNGRTPLTDQLARPSIERIGNNLRVAVETGEHLHARRELSLASLMAGMAFTNAGLGATHAISMATGAVMHTPHGVTIAYTLPAVIRYNAAVVPERYAAIAAMLGEETAGMSTHTAALAAADAVERLAADVGIEGGLAALDVGTDDVSHLAERASQLERLLVGNPRRTDVDDLEEIIRAAL